MPEGTQVNVRLSPTLERMGHPQRGGFASGAGAYTLIEILLVTGLLVLLMSLVMPNVLKDLVEARLPESARQMRALLQLTRAYAMLEGRRYRIRFPREDEIDATGEQRQPLVEVEDKPLEQPEVYRAVLAAWAQEPVLERDIRCAQVILGKPTVEEMLGKFKEDKAERQEIEQAVGEKFDEGFPPLIIEADGTSEWATFVITDAPPEVAYEDLRIEDANSEYGRIEVILDGLTGLAWLQRALYEQELQMMQEHGWPPVMRKDFLDPVMLTEDNVLEIRETRIRK